MLLKFRELLRKTVANVRPPHRRVRETNLFQSSIGRLLRFVHRVAGRRDDEHVVAGCDGHLLGDDRLVTVVARGLPHHDLAEVDMIYEPWFLYTVNRGSDYLFPGDMRIRVIWDRETNSQRELVLHGPRVFPFRQRH